MSIALTWSYGKGQNVTYFDEMRDLFRTLGLSEAQAQVAAVGRYRSEAEARQALDGNEAEDLADSMFGQPAGQVLPLRTREATEISAEIGRVQENVMRRLAGQPMLQPCWELPVGSATPAAEAAVIAAREGLRMTGGEAAAFVTRLQVRETTRGGAAHAERFLTDFAAGLRRNVREVREVAV